MLLLYTYYSISSKLGSATLKIFIKAKQQTLKLLAGYERALILASLGYKTLFSLLFL